MIRLVALALLAAAQAGPEATPPAPPAPAQGLSQGVPSVTVTAHRPVVVTAQPCPEPSPERYPAVSDPKVVDSFPRGDGDVRPGFTQVRVTFDAPMSCYAEVTSQGGGEQDPCEPRGSWALPGRRSFLLRCRLEPGATYAFKFRRDAGRGFVGLSGRDAQAYTLRFTTSDADPVASWSEAEAADPGPPDAPTPRAYVTCADVARSAAASDCSRQRFGAPTPPP